MRSKNGGDGGTGVYMREGTTSRVTAADRTYSKFYDFYSARPENFGSTYVLQHSKELRLKCVIQLTVTEHSVYFIIQYSCIKLRFINYHKERGGAGREGGRKERKKGKMKKEEKKKEKYFTHFSRQFSLQNYY